MAARAEATRASSSPASSREPGARRARGGDHRHLGTEPTLPLRDRLPRALRGDEVGLGEGQHARQPRQTLVVGGELPLDRRVVGDRVRALARRELRSDVEHVHEQARALHVREEVVPQARALARPLDQTRDVSHDQLAFLAFEHAQHRRERGERIVGHLRRGPRQPREQRGLAGVRQPHQTHVGEQLEPQLEPAFLPRRDRARRSAAPGGWRGKALVPLSAGLRRAPRVALLARREQLPAASAEIPVLTVRRR